MQERKYQYGFVQYRSIPIRKKKSYGQSIYINIGMVKFKKNLISISNFTSQ